MPFNPEHFPRRFSPSPVPVLEHDQKRHLERELNDVRMAIDSLVDAVAEIQAHLESQP
jgi:adenylate kinase